MSYKDNVASCKCNFAGNVDGAAEVGESVFQIYNVDPVAFTVYKGEGRFVPMCW